MSSIIEEQEPNYTFSYRVQRHTGEDNVHTLSFYGDMTDAEEAARLLDYMNVRMVVWAGSTGARVYLKYRNKIIRGDTVTRPMKRGLSNVVRQYLAADNID